MRLIVVYIEHYYCVGKPGNPLTIFIPTVFRPCTNSDQHDQYSFSDT